MMRKEFSMRIKKISSKTDYRCPYFKIVKTGFSIPGQKKTAYWYLLKRGNYVSILAKEGNYLYMVELYRFAIEKKSLEFPAGIIEKNETPREAAKRELEEETGIIAKKLTLLDWYYAFIGMSDCKSYVFLAENLSFNKQKLDRSEFGMKIKKVKISDVENLVRKGKIRGEHNINSFYVYKLKGKKLMPKNDPNCKNGLDKNIINKEVFGREISLCQKLSNKNNGKCGWGKCMDCGVVPLLYKLHKGKLLEDSKAKKIKEEIFK